MYGPRPVGIGRFQDFPRQDATGPKEFLARGRNVEGHIVNVKEGRPAIVVGHVNLGQLQHPRDSDPLGFPGSVFPHELGAFDAQHAAGRVHRHVGRVGQLPLDFPGGFALGEIVRIGLGGGESLPDNVRDGGFGAGWNDDLCFVLPGERFGRFG
jgi:hypothetical protein